MSFKHRREPDRGDSPAGTGVSATKPATTAPHSRVTGAGDANPPPGAATPRYIDDKDIRVLNNLLDDLKRLDTCRGEERLELEPTAGESGDGDVLLEHKDRRTEQVTSTGALPVSTVMLMYDFRRRQTRGPTVSYTCGKCEPDFSENLGNTVWYDRLLCLGNGNTNVVSEHKGVSVHCGPLFMRGVTYKRGPL